MRTINKIIAKCDCKFGAPMGRSNVIPKECNIHVDTNTGKSTCNGKKVFDCKVPMSSDSAYDSGSAYWGLGRELRVQYTKDLSYIKFYRK